MVRSTERPRVRLTSIRYRVATACSAAAVILAVSAPAQAARSGEGPCARADLSVKGNGLPSQAYTVAGRLCRKRGGTKRVLLITAHGATYNHLYWDWPQNPDVYSFRKNVVSRRVSLLNLDLLGSGRSSHPLSLHVTQEVQASMLHQLVQKMRRRGFRRIILVGHSSGSGAITLEASTYDDVDGLIVTGMLHPEPSAALGLLDSLPVTFYPAALDPAFAGMNLDAGYVTTRPGTRGQPALYNKEAADPKVIAYDDAHKDVVPMPHAMGFFRIFGDASISRAVNAPVLLLVGAYDGFCGSPSCPEADDEATAWSPAADLELHVIPKAGHDIHLHRKRYGQMEYTFVRRWLDRRF